jgi:hypothetical protein
LSTLVGAVEARCVGSTVTILSWDLLPLLQLGQVDPGPGAEARITVVDVLLLEIGVTVGCVGGEPAVV